MTVQERKIQKKMYRDAVQYIALNDAPGDSPTVDDYQGFVTVGLVAALFQVETIKVARAVHRANRIFMKEYLEARSK